MKNLSDSINAHFNCSDADVQIDEFDMSPESFSLTAKVRGEWFDIYYTPANEIRLVLEAA